MLLFSFNMRKSDAFRLFSLSFIGGVFFCSFFPKYYFIAYPLIIAAISALVVFYGNKKIIAASLAVLFFVFGAWILEKDLKKIERVGDLGENFSGIAIVAKEPEHKGNYQNIIVKNEKGLKILLRADPNREVKYGDELQLSCRLKIPENRNEDFDYQAYLAKDGIYYLCQSANFKITGESRGSGFYGAVLKTKNRMENAISEIIPEPQASLGNGLLFGGKSGLSKSAQEDFNRTGMSHITAVSGFNVAIIAEYLMLAGIWLGLWRKHAFYFALSGIFLFVLMIGFPSSAVRAAVMGGLLIWAMKNGRLANSENAILFAGAIMLLLNPMLLRWDIGFQLSFLATLGIVELSPFWEKLSFKKYHFSFITEIIFLTISAQIFVLPILIYNFHNLSLVSLLANILILPIIPLTMLLVFLSALGGLFLGYFSYLPAWLAFLPLKYEMEVISWLSELSWASMEIKNFSWLGVLIWYAFLFGTVFLLKKKLYNLSES